MLSLCNESFCFSASRADCSRTRSVTTLDGNLMLKNPSDVCVDEGCVDEECVDEPYTVRDTGAAYILPLSRPHGLIRPHLHRICTGRQTPPPGLQDTAVGALHTAVGALDIVHMSIPLQLAYGMQMSRNEARSPGLISAHLHTVFPPPVPYRRQEGRTGRECRLRPASPFLPPLHCAGPKPHHVCRRHVGGQP